MTTLIACSHGTRFEEGREAVRALVDEVRTLLPDVRVEQAFVDVEEPEVGDVVARVAADGPAVVVPLLLSTGFHTEVDIARAVAPFPHVVKAPALGPHDLLALVLEARLDESWKHPVLGYSLSYARTLELEARLLEKEWSGEPGLFARSRLR